MATARLLASSYAFSSSTYLSISNAANMYTDTDSDTYATITNSQNGTTTYYLYIRGFDFDSIPSNAIINSWTVKLKARESGVNTSTSYSPKLCNGTSQITSTCSAITTTATVHEFTDVGADWADIIEYGDSFGIRINCRRANRNTTAYMYVYGAEIEVNYTVPNPRTVTSTLRGEGTISPSGAYSTYDGAEYTLTITPADVTEEVTVTVDGTDVTSQLVGHRPGSTMTKSAEDCTTHSIQSGSSYAEYAVGHTAESPSTSGTSSNMYASSGSTGYAEYTFDFSSIPSGATIESIEVRVYGHRENSTIDSTHVSSVTLYSGSTQKGETEHFTSTSNQLITVSEPGTWTRDELQSATLRHTVGYYGGLVLGISWDVTYSTGGNITHYTYTFTVSSSANIAVTIGSTEKAYIKLGGTWVEAASIYKKVNGTWVKQTEVTNIFESGVNYRYG